MHLELGGSTFSIKENAKKRKRKLEAPVVRQMTGDNFDLGYIVLVIHCTDQVTRPPVRTLPAMGRPAADPIQGANPLIRKKPECNLTVNGSPF